MGRLKGVKETGLAGLLRREGRERREKHKLAIQSGQLLEEAPEPLLPEVFREIQEVYWDCLKAVKDPRDQGKVVYPLYRILHRIIAGFLGGNNYIGVLFPKRHHRKDSEERKGHKLGALPTKQTVYDLLRRINWEEANVKLSPLWEHLGYDRNFVISRALRDPVEILKEFREEEAQKAARRAEEHKAKQKAMEKKEGMSAAQAKRQGQRKRNSKTAKGKVEKKSGESDLSAMGVKKGECSEGVVNGGISPVRYDVVIDGKVLRASYNMSRKERFVHVTKIEWEGEGFRKRFIVGARATELDRNGEWGAGMSVLDALTPVSRDVHILVSADAGLCVEEYANWLTVRSFFYLFRIKQNAGHIFERVMDWAEFERKRRPEGDFYESSRVSGSAIHSRRLWRLKELRYSVFPGIKEGFVIEKKDLIKKPLLISNIISPVNQQNVGLVKESWIESFCTGIRKQEYLV